MWQQKHSPPSLDAFLGKASAEEARKWDGRPLIIHGGTGTGKTTLARLIAADRGYDVVEVSDENIGSAENMANTGSIFGNPRMLLIENVDAIKDIKAVAAIVDDSKNPIILTTSDYSSKRLSTIKKKCAELQLRRALPASIAKHLQTIAEAEGVSVEKAVLEQIAKGCGGDIRAALNDLETLSTGRKNVREADTVGVKPERDRQSDIYKALSTIFGGRDFAKVVESTWDLDEELRDVIWWVEENTPRLYQDRQAIHDAYGNLSRADIFMGRIMRRQHWGFLKYANTLITAGVNSSRPAKVNFAQYMFPGYFSAMGRSKGDRKIEASISAKMGPKVHASARLIRGEYIPLYRHLLKNNKADIEGLRGEYKLEDEEIEYLTGA
ncbi:MAG: AAA family ATPase [Candidatus Altiarchaeota archaeon]